MPTLPDWKNALDAQPVPLDPRGLAKKKGGIGMHVTKATPRWHLPNLKTKRVWVPELKKFVTVKATARAFKTLSKNGAYKTLSDAGVVR